MVKLIHKDLSVECSSSLSFGGASPGVDEPTVNLSYLSIFITHFLISPTKNSGILRKFYVDLSLTAAKISEITKGRWSKTNILTGLKKNNITREIARSRISYGEKRVRGKIVKNQYELKVIDLIMVKHNEGLSYHEIALYLNSKNIPTKYKKSKWLHKTIEQIIKRIQKTKENS